VTVEGTRHLLEAAARSGVKKFIYVSSVKAMGEGAKSCQDESSIAEPMTSYGRAKLEAERLVLEAGKKHGMHVCNLRLPMVYGRDNRGNLWHMIAAIDRGRFPPLPETGNKRSMVHVDDVIQALQLVLEDTDIRGRTYIVTDGQAYSTRQIYIAIHEALGRAVPRWTIPVGMLRATARLGDVIGGIQGRSFVFNSGTLEKLIGSAWYSCRRIEAELDYRPTRTLTDGLREMVNQYRMARQR
jgi:nucleoside-diphosphate-sugar epimerase